MNPVIIMNRLITKYMHNIKVSYFIGTDCRTVIKHYSTHIKD